MPHRELGRSNHGPHAWEANHQAEVRDFVAAAVARCGRIDVAFNNAGIETQTAAPLHEQSVEDWENVQRTNSCGVFLSMKYELPHMLTAGRGAIINNASVSAEVGFATISPYSASKHAIASLTKVAALECADRNIRVNAGPRSGGHPDAPARVRSVRPELRPARAGLPGQADRVGRRDRPCRDLAGLAGRQRGTRTNIDASADYLAR
jgi:NAD(P)-dependent dehydrogenase (short-subunit alcohol dehydrogenase family)